MASTYFFFFFFGFALTFKADGFLLPKKPAVIVKAKPKKKK